MGPKNLLSWLLALILILVSVAGCKDEPIAIELIPQDANLIANIQVGKILSDQDLRNAYDEAKKELGQPQTFEEVLNEFVKEMGVDLRDCSQATIFADVTTLEEANYLGFFIEGTFDQQQFVDNIKEETGEEFTLSEYKDYKLFVDQKGESAITSLGDTMLLFGTTNAVKDVIDVSKGDRPRVSGMILDTYNQLGDTLIKVAFEFPEEAQKGITEEPISGDIPISVEAFADIDIIGFTLNKEAETITIQVDSHFLSTDSAQDAKDTISGAIMLFKGTLQVPEVKELLGKIQVAVTDFWVTIVLDITLSELEELIETF